MYILEITGPQRNTLFMKLKDVFPECEVLISDAPQLFPLRCLWDSCPRNANCMGKLAHRLKYIFDQFEKVDLVVLYFAYRDRPGSIRAGIFWRDMREPYFRTLNRTGWEKMKKLGTVYEWRLPDWIFLGTKPPEPGAQAL